MKYIKKGSPPASFENWKLLTNDDWQPTYHDLKNPEKQDLHKSLLSEQGWVCCYCGQSVSLENSHIEHFRPQHSYPKRELCYENLFASCLRERKPGAPLHCGHAKGENFDENRHISPLDSNCEQQFIYTLRGAILPSVRSDERAEYMAALLELDSPRLRALREEILGNLFDEKFLATATADELQRLRDDGRDLDGDGKLHDFGHVIARYAEQCLTGMVDTIPGQTGEPPPA